MITKHENQRPMPDTAGSLYENPVKGAPEQVGTPASLPTTTMPFNVPGTPHTEAPMATPPDAPMPRRM